MVYSRQIGDRELSFEASGALLEATLVMRDRETDSWWSIITSDAIGGPLEGSDLPELPIGEKLQWSAWVARYPHTLVLSVDGIEHVDEDPYAAYFTSDRTFRDLKVDDHRLPAKEPIFAFQLDGKPWAASHQGVENGKAWRVGSFDLYLYRPAGASVFASTEAYRLDRAEAGANPQQLTLDRARAAVSAGQGERLVGIDTFWYSWVAIHRESGLLRSDGSSAGNSESSSEPSTQSPQS